MPIWHKPFLTLEEASSYFGICVHKIKELTDDDNCSFVVWNGSKRLIKRQRFEEYLVRTYSI